MTRDYPSLGQLRYVFEKHKIQAIFAVTKEVKWLYEVKHVSALFALKVGVEWLF